MPGKKIIFTFLASLLMKMALSQPKLIDLQYSSGFKWPARPLISFNETRQIKPAGPNYFSLSTMVAGKGLSPAFYVQTMGWSCQQEWKWEKTTKVPLRIRLGSQDQADWLDGKRKTANGW
jgi:hypothetical protein